MKKSIVKILEEIAMLKEKLEGSKTALNLAREEVNKIWVMIIGVAALILTAIGIILSKR